MPRNPTPNPAARTVALVRISILAFVLAAGALIWLLHRNPSWTPSVPGFPVEPIAMALWAGAVVGIVGVRYQWGNARDAVHRGRLSIIAIAIAEAPALFGAVVYFLTDDPRLYLSGLFLMLTTLILFPIVRHR